jgi:heme/copper-type cytochrome/quinol oxidase subunit 1
VIVILTFLTKQLIKLDLSTSGGWTAYPPLLDLSPEQKPEINSNPFFDTIAHFFSILQIIITICLLIVTYL